MQVKVAIDNLNHDNEVDNAVLTNFAEIIRSRPQEYSAEEADILRRGRDFFKSHHDSADYTLLNTSDPKVVVKAVHVDGSSLVAGAAVTVVDTDAANCLSYEFTKDTRAAKKAMQGKSVVEVSLERHNDHCYLYRSVRYLGVPGFSNREWRIKMVWEKCDDGTYFAACENTKDLDEEFPVKAGNVVASSQVAWLLEPLPKIGNIPQTRVSFVARVDVKGAVPNFIMNQLTGNLTRNVSLMRKKFDKSDEIDAENRSIIISRMKAMKDYQMVDFEHRFNEIKGKVRDAAFIVELK